MKTNLCQVLLLHTLWVRIHHAQARGIVGRSLHALALSVALAASLPVWGGEPQFIIQDLGTLGGVESGANGINAKGEVVGWSNIPDGRTRAFLFSHGEMVLLPSLGGFSEALAINDHGWVVGFCFTPAGEFTPHATLWIDGAPHDLGLFVDGETSSAEDVNNAGQIVGYATKTVAGRQRSRPVLWEAGEMIELPTLGGEGVAHGINDRGEIVGMVAIGFEVRAAVWRNRELEVLPLRGQLFNLAVEINRNGTIVGTGFLDFDNFVSLWGKSVGALGAGLPADINDAGLIVGSRRVSTEAGNYHAGLWIEEGQVTLLTPAVGFDFSLSGVNNAGQASGTLSVNEFTPHAVLVTRRK